MADAKHTPGPWVLIRSGMRDNSAVATEEPRPETMVEPNYWLVAQANTLRDEWEANARLIAAAPESHEANKAALMVLCALEKANDWHPNMEKDIAFAIAAIRAAIAKATPQP